MTTLRLYRTLDNTEITNTSTRIVFDPGDWTMVPGEPNEDGDPTVVAVINNVTLVFPGPSLLDLGTALSRAELWNHGFSNSGPYVKVAESGNILLLNFLTQILLANYIVFTPGSLTLNVV